MEVSETRRGPRTGMKNRIKLASLIAIPISRHASVKKRHWREWKRTKRFRLYGPTARKNVAGMNVRYPKAPAIPSGNIPTRPWARVAVCMGRPQPAQNAAASGICAEQWGQETAMRLGQRLQHNLSEA